MLVRPSFRPEGHLADYVDLQCGQLVALRWKVVQAAFLTSQSMH